MSALSPHIRALRAESDALAAALTLLEKRDGPQILTVRLILLELADAKLKAADALEAEQRELEARITSIPPRQA